MSYTLTTGLILRDFLSDAQAEQFFSDEADVEAMLQFEHSLALAQAGAGLISADAANAIGKAVAAFDPALDSYSARVAKDGVSPPVFVAQLRELVDDAHADRLHFGATSQDLIDTSLMLRVAALLPIYGQRLDQILAALNMFTEGGRASEPAMAHTRMQRALPITRADRIAAWRDPLLALSMTLPDEFPLQLGGPEGALGAMEDSGSKVASLMGEALGLTVPTRCWHTDRRPITELATWLTSVTTALGKIGQDIVLLAQNEVASVRLTGGGSSSAMAHKNNPVVAEVLISQARLNSTLVGGLHQAALHEYERSGAGWTLEWMLLPQLVINTGAALNNAQRLLESIEFQSEGIG